MNKVISIVMLSLAFVSVKADENSTRIEQITTAIEESDLVRVKTLWRRLDSSLEILDEKEKVLKALVKTASHIAEDSKTTPGIGGGGRNYKLVVAGFGLWAVSIGGAVAGRLILDGGSVDQAKFIGGIALFGGSMGLAYYAGTLMRDGWNGSSDQITAGGRSKAKIVEAYLESRLQELNDEIAAHKKSNGARNG